MSTEVTTPARNVNLWPLGTFIEEHGGYYAGIVRGEEGQPSHHLFVAKEDAAADDLTWGEYGKTIDGASFVRRMRRPQISNLVLHQFCPIKETHYEQSHCD